MQCRFGSRYCIFCWWFALARSFSLSDMHGGRCCLGSIKTDAFDSVGENFYKNEKISASSKPLITQFRINAERIVCMCLSVWLICAMTSGGRYQNRFSKSLRLLLMCSLKKNRKKTRENVEKTCCKPRAHYSAHFFLLSFFFFSTLWFKMRNNARWTLLLNGTILQHHRIINNSNWYCVSRVFPLIVAVHRNRSDSKYIQSNMNIADWIRSIRPSIHSTS